MPTKRLPENSDLDHLKAQAKRLAKACGRRNPTACQRLREFHPHFAGESDSEIAATQLTWSDALFAIAREYGFASWPRLKRHVDITRGAVDEKPFIDRIADPVLRSAVEAMDDGNIDALRELLETHPDLVTRRANFEGENYFRTPSLLAFIAENPVRNDALPVNIVEIARLLLERGADICEADLDETLALVASGRVAREAGAQPALLALLVEHGADPEAGLDAALVHGEFDAARCLIALGARMSLPAAAAFGEVETVRHLLNSGSVDGHLATALAAQHGHAEILEFLLRSGEDPNRFNPPGAHSHSTPLHQAAGNGHSDAVSVLVRNGADMEIRDAMWNGTPLDWARYAGESSMIDLFNRLRRQDSGNSRPQARGDASRTA